MSTELLRSAMSNKPSAKRVKQHEEAGVMLDMAGNGNEGNAMSYDDNDIKMAAAASIQQWVESNDLSGNENCANRLLALMIGIADENKDGEITDDEQAVLDTALECAWDYLASKGVEGDDISSLLNDWDNDAAERIKDLVASVLPEGDEAASVDIDSFVFGGDQEPEPTLDAAYKKKTVVRDGKKVRINKRVSGKVRLSGKQKVALRKARMKSHSATARMRRRKSMNIRKKTGVA